MRSAARIFAAIGTFGLAAALLFAIGLGDKRGAQGATVLLSFSAACWFLFFLLRSQGRLELDGLHLPVDAHAEDEEIHLPGPSWWPFGYGIAAPVLLLGLVFSTPLLLVGAALVVGVSVLWGLESVRDYRREIAHHKDEPDIAPMAIEAAHAMQAFAAAHHGADAVVQHVTNGKAEVVLVGADGRWGTVAVDDVAHARAAVALAGLTAHDSWTLPLQAKVAGEPELWVRMGTSKAYVSPRGHEGPRDGNTQTGAKMFRALGVFALIAASLFFSGYRNRYGTQGAVILLFFGVANFYLYIALKNARGSDHDAPWNDPETGVFLEPTEPDPPVDLATLHLPGPSWWPAAFSVAAVLLVLGLVFGGALLWLGLGGVVLCSAGWGLESVKEYRATVLQQGGHGSGH